MAWKRDSKATFTGGSGQMAVMAELLHRGCNAAIPVVDIGTDVFAFRDDCEEVARIQVKTAPGKSYKNGVGYAAKFDLPMNQLKQTDAPPLFYALAVRLGNSWGSIIVISRSKLQELWNDGLGSENKTSDNLQLRIRFAAEKIVVGQNEQQLQAICGKQKPFYLTDYIDAWESLPPLKPVVGIDANLHEGNPSPAPGGSSALGAS